jgi:hypothetical protein
MDRRRSREFEEQSAAGAAHAEELRKARHGLSSEQRGPRTLDEDDEVDRVVVRTWN